MPQKTWVVGEETLAADFNLFVQQQVVARFATVAARDAAWPAATAGPGAVCITYDTSTVWVVNSAVAWVALATPPTPWTAVAFTPPWTNYGGAFQVCQYRKTLDTVELRGLCKGGVQGSSVLVLPVGFRPAINQEQIPAVAAGVFGYLQINNTGSVDMASGNGASLDISMVRFSVLP